MGSQMSGSNGSSTLGTGRGLHRTGWLLFVLDIVAAFASAIIVLCIRFDTPDLTIAVLPYLPAALLPFAVRPLVHIAFGLHRREWRVRLGPGPAGSRQGRDGRLRDRGRGVPRPRPPRCAGHEPLPAFVLPAGAPRVPRPHGGCADPRADVARAPERGRVLRRLDADAGLRRRQRRRDHRADGHGGRPARDADRRVHRRRQAEARLTAPRPSRVRRARGPSARGRTDRAPPSCSWRSRPANRVPFVARSMPPRRWG